MISKVACRVSVALSAALTLLAPVATHAEVRALWVVRTSLTSTAAIDAMVAAAKAGGFNTVLVQIRGRGDAYYQHALEPQPAALAAQLTFDPLAVTIARAHEADLKVHAWINVNLVAGLDLPLAREHIVHRHPEWLMVPASLAEDLNRIDPRSPQYIGRLLRYARARSNEVEGLYLSPAPDAARAYTLSVIRDIVQRYAVDGVHLDYVRYPEDDFDFGRETLAAFRRDVVARLGAPDQRRYDGLLVSDALAYVRAFPERWRSFRSDRLTALVSTIRDLVSSLRPAAVLSAAVAPDASEAALHRLQDWRTWLDQGLIDVACPMAYTTDAGLFEAQIAAARQIAGDRPLWAGIGAYRLSIDRIVENIQTARRLGVGGIVLFSYDSLTDPPRGPEYLTQLARAAFRTQ